MPIFRYFLLVGGTLLGLLVLADWYFPNAPREASAGDIDRSVIRIHSSQRWPAPVNIDTNVVMQQAAPPARIEQSAQVTPAGKPASAAYAYLPPPESKPTESMPTEAKPLDKPQRRASRIARLSKRTTHRRIVAWQPLWQPDWQSTW
jgi:hypothetical protein